MQNVLDMLLFHHRLNGNCCFQAHKNEVQQNSCSYCETDTIWTHLMQKNTGYFSYIIV